MPDESCYRVGTRGARSVRPVVACSAALVCCVITLHAWQHYSPYANEMQSPEPDPPDAGEKTEWAFARLRYRSYGGWRRSSWGIDSNTAEHHFVQGIRRLSRVHARSSEEVIDVDSDEVYNWPWLYAVEVGHWTLSDSQAKHIRTYLDRGGFLMVDDFHGTYEWSVFMEGLQKVFPDRTVVDIDDRDPIFHILYDLHERVQVPGEQFVYSGRTYEKDGVEAKWRGIYDDKGRIQVA